MAKLFLALGSNLGDRESNLKEALARLGDVFGAIADKSPILETKACGFDGPDFLNCIVVYETRRRPDTILKICKRIEVEMGRTDTVEYDKSGNRVYHDRIIDIDILLYGNKVVDAPDLMIPHPQLQTRPYIGELMRLLSVPSTVSIARK